jgi:CHASE2 domain-containing sensor protein
MKNFIKTKWFTFATYVLLVAATLLIGYILLQNNSSLKNVIWSFFEVAESRTFDYRQSLRVAHKHPIPNKDIVILAIDDASFEILWDKYGEWPFPREMYGNIIHHIEKSNPQAIIFDLMFIKSMKSAASSDKVLVDAMNKYNNVYTSMNFDNQEADIRTPLELPERISIKVNQEEGSKVNLKKSSFINQEYTQQTKLVMKLSKIQQWNLLPTKQNLKKPSSTSLQCPPP